MEVDLLDGRTVNLGFGVRNRRECRIGKGANSLRNFRPGDELAQMAKVAAVRLRRDREIHLDARDIGAHDVPNVDLHAVQSQLGGQRAQPVGVEPAMDERAERHVAGYTAERVENRDRHGAGKDT